MTEFSELQVSTLLCSVRTPLVSPRAGADAVSRPPALPQAVGSLPLLGRAETLGPVERGRDRGGQDSVIREQDDRFSSRHGGGGCLPSRPPSARTGFASLFGPRAGLPQRGRGPPQPAAAPPGARNVASIRFARPRALGSGMAAGTSSKARAPCGPCLAPPSALGQCCSCWMCVLAG